MQRREFIRSTALAGFAFTKIDSLSSLDKAVTLKTPGYEIALLVPCKLFDGKTCWAHPRGGVVAITNGIPEVTFMMAMLDLSGNDIFTGMWGFSTSDYGKTFSEPKKIEALSLQRREIDGKVYNIGIGDVVPQLHKATNTLLATGHTLNYSEDWKPASPYPKRTAYAVYDAKQKEWKAWKKMEIPDELDYKGTGAGCSQRVDLPDGKILLPVSFKKTKGNSGVTVMLCSFDGENLVYEKHGNELFVEDTTRGLGEPSLTFFQKKYFLTIRHDQRGYITTSHNGLDFEPLKPWTFDDGTELGNYNTQQHWVTHSDGLFLTYTRRGANNDHVFRNRAPLFMAQVDLDKLCVIRETEKIILPENGARYGNFGISQIDQKETWITESEWMQPKGVEKYGSDGKVYVAKIKWNKKNNYPPWQRHY